MELDVHQSQAFVDLHGQIKSCDEILETMENLLSIFQNDLGNISAEIQTLQTKSVSMSIQLKNRMVRIVTNIKIPFFGLRIASNQELILHIKDCRESFELPP